MTTTTIGELKCRVTKRQLESAVFSFYDRNLNETRAFSHDPNSLPDITDVDWMFTDEGDGEGPTLQIIILS